MAHELRPNVVNKYKHIPTENDVYIGRGSKWGNPFVIGKDGDRAQVVDKFSEWVVHQEHLLGCLHELRGKNLVCFCHPQSCHGDILCELVDWDLEREAE